MTPGNDPEIPSLKPLGGKEEDKKGGASLPSSAKPATPSGFKFPGFGGGSTGASKAFSAPNLKVRGLSGGGSTVMDRLKNLRKKDLIFIGAGLCTLGMAPLAEHLLMSPDEQTAKLQEGFNSQQGPLFQDGSSVYEPGNGVGSPGGLVGQGADVITPLNVRDPSNLIMSPGAQKKADAVVAPPPSSPAPSKGESDWKDVLRDSAKSGAGKAVSQSPKLPKPNVKMAGAIRGLSALGGGGGGTGASLKLDPLSAANVPNKAAGSGALTRSQATPGFRGATSRSGASSGAGEDLRAAGSKQSDIFNRGGGAAAALDAASREAIPAGGSAGGAGGRPGEGGETKNPGGNSQKDNKSLGESLAFLRQKMEMEKSLDLKWEKKKWNQFGRQKMLEESAIKLGFDMFGKFAEKAVIGPLGDFIGQSIIPSGAVTGVNCQTESGPVMLKNSDSGKYRCIGNSAQFFGKDGAPGSKMECSRGCFPLGGGGDAAAPSGNPNADGENPSQVGSVRRPGAARFREQERAMADTSSRVGTEARQAAVIAEQIKAKCDGIQGAPTAKAKCMEFHGATVSLGGGLTELEKGSAFTAKAWGHLTTASSNLEGENQALNKSMGSLKTAADKLTAAEKELTLPPGTKELPADLDKKFKPLVDQARTAVKEASVEHNRAGVNIAKTETELGESTKNGGLAEAPLESSKGTIEGLQIPKFKPEDAQGTTVDMSGFAAQLTSAQQQASKTWGEVKLSYNAWKEAQGKAEAARTALHDTAKDPSKLTIDPEKVPSNISQTGGALGAAYDNYVTFAIVLSQEKDNPYQTAYTKGKEAFASALKDPAMQAQAAEQFNAAVKSEVGASTIRNAEMQAAAQEKQVAAVSSVMELVNSVKARPQPAAAGVTPAPAGGTAP